MAIPIVEASDGRPGQIAVLVPDLEAALARHGLSPHAEPAWRIWTYDERIVRERFYRGGEGRFTMRLALGGTHPQLELIQPLQGPSAYHDWIAQHGYGFHHVGYYVPDARATTAAMERAGFEVLMGGSGFGADGSGAFAYYDTVAALGYVTEAIEVPARRHEPEALWPPPATQGG